VDTTPPKLTPVPDQTDEATGPNGAAASFAATATDVVDGTDPVVFKEGSAVVHSGDTFSLGSHLITASATDAAGNTASETFTIKVVDTTPPKLTPVPDQTDEATGPNGAVATFAATATDIVDGTDPVVFKEGTTIVHSGDTFSLGSHLITASATDAAGNAASETFTITVTGASSLTIAPADKVQQPAPIPETNRDPSFQTASGVIRFTDNNVAYRPTASALSVTPYYQSSEGRTKPLDTNAAAQLEAGFTVSPDPANTNNGVIYWQYRVSDKLIDRLVADGDTLKLTAIVKIDDQHGSSDTATIILIFLPKHSTSKQAEPAADLEITRTAPNGLPASANGQSSAQFDGGLNTRTLNVMFTSSGGVKSVAFAVDYNPEFVTVMGAEPGPDLPENAQLAFTTEETGDTAQARIVVTSDDALPAGAINLAALELARPLDGDTSGLLGVRVEHVNGAMKSPSDRMGAPKVRIPYRETQSSGDEINGTFAEKWRVNFSTDEQNPNARIRLAIPIPAADGSGTAADDDRDASIVVNDTEDASDAPAPLNAFRIAIPDGESAAPAEPAILTAQEARWKLRLSTGEADQPGGRVRIPMAAIAKAEIAQHPRI
jgi:hypothetical protein